MSAPSAVELAELVRTRIVSAVEVAERSLSTIDEHEAELNAFITIMRDSALRDARAVDAALGRGEDVGPLAGIPFAAKDNFITVDADSSGGSSVFLQPAAAADAAAIGRLRTAGAVLVGKTNMNEFGWGLDTRVGPVANPVIRGRSAGGSSGGSAAAVAVGAVPFAVGSDGGGSIRMPAAFCGVVGLKPTHGSVPHEGLLPSSRTLTDPGPISGTVADARLMMDTWTTTRSEPALRHGGRLAVVNGSLRTCKPTVQEALARAFELLARPEPIDLETSEATTSWFVIFASEAAAELAPFVGDARSALSADLQRLLDDGERFSARDRERARSYARSLALRIDAALEHYDCLALPTVPSLPPGGEPAWDDDDFFGDMRWTVLANLTGHPAITIPVPFAREPIGLQLIGRRGADDALLTIAEDIETAFGMDQDPEGRSDGA